MKNSDLYTAAQNLVSAETTYLRMQEYRDNLPADQEYDLGPSISLKWGSSTNGYDETRRALERQLRVGMRTLIDHALEEAKQNLFEAQRLVAKVASRA